MEEEAKTAEPKKNNLNALIFITAIIILIGAIIFLAKNIPFISPETVNYNYFKFSKIDNLWHTKWQSNTGKEYVIAFRYLPQETLSVQVTGEINESFNERNITYITFDPLSESNQFKYLGMAAVDLAFAFKGPLNKNMEMACTVNQTDACVKIETATCNDINKSVIYIKAQGEPKIELKENCVTLQGSELELIKAVDRLLYQYYKIIR